MSESNFKNLEKIGQLKAEPFNQDEYAEFRDVKINIILHPISLTDDPNAI